MFLSHVCSKLKGPPPFQTVTLPNAVNSSDCIRLARLFNSLTLHRRNGQRRIQEGWLHVGGHIFCQKQHVIKKFWTTMKIVQRALKGRGQFKSPYRWFHETCCKHTTLLFAHFLFKIKYYRIVSRQLTSCPAPMMVMTSSISSLSVKPRPLTSSLADIIMSNRSSGTKLVPVVTFMKEITMDSAFTARFYSSKIILIWFVINLKTAHCIVSKTYFHFLLWCTKGWVWQQEFGVIRT